MFFFLFCNSGMFKLAAMAKDGTVGKLISKRYSWFAFFKTGCEQLTNVLKMCYKCPWKL